MEFFIPKERKFFDLFEAEAEKVVEIAELLKRLGENYDELPRLAERSKEMEDEADAIVHQICDLAVQTFVTPFDREDIRSLAQNLDSVVDRVDSALYRLSINNFETLPPVISEFSEVISQTAKEIRMAMYCLRRLGKKGKVLSEHCIKINELENKADSLNRATLKEMTQSNPSSAVELLRLLNLREIIIRFEEAMDKSEDVANILETIRMQYG